MERKIQESEIMGYVLSHRGLSSVAVNLLEVLDATLNEIDDEIERIQSDAKQRDFLAGTHWRLVSLGD